MRHLAPALALLGLSACANPEDVVENSIRSELAKRGEVKEVEMKPDGDGRFTGFALIRVDGQDGRLDCKAARKSGAAYDWDCQPTIDEAVLTGMEDMLRRSLEAQQVTVVEIDMQRDGGDRMKGFAVARDQGGEEARLTCTAWREAASFEGECELLEGARAAG